MHIHYLIHDIYNFSIENISIIKCKVYIIDFTNFIKY